MADPDTVDGWLALANQHEQMARIGCESKTAAQQGYFHAVMAVECALKAYIWHRARFNERPSQQERPELYSHNIRLLKDKANILPKPTDPNGASWIVILNANRGQYYDPKPMPRKVARQVVDAAFSEVGVVTWIRRQLNRLG